MSDGIRVFDLVHDFDLVARLKTITNDPNNPGYLSMEDLTALHLLLVTQSTDLDLDLLKESMAKVLFGHPAHLFFSCLKHAVMHQASDLHIFCGWANRQDKQHFPRANKIIMRVDGTMYDLPSVSLYDFTPIGIKIWPFLKNAWGIDDSTHRHFGCRTTSLGGTKFPGDIQGIRAQFKDLEMPNSKNTFFQRWIYRRSNPSIQKWAGGYGLFRIMYHPNGQNGHIQTEPHVSSPVTPLIYAPDIQMSAHQGAVWMHSGWRQQALLDTLHEIWTQIGYTPYTMFSESEPTLPLLR